MRGEERLTQAADQIVVFVSKHADKQELAARDFAFSLARTYMGEELATRWDSSENFLQLKNNF